MANRAGQHHDADSDADSAGGEPRRSANSATDNNTTTHLATVAQVASSPAALQEAQQQMRDEQHRYGYGSWTPAFLQRIHNPKCLLVCLSLCAITQGLVVNGLVPVSISTLEKRFDLNSAQSGLFSAFYDISVLLVLIPVCHFGAHGHKGRWVGLGAIVMGLGSFVCVLPQFLSGDYDVGEGLREYCSAGAEIGGDTRCVRSSSSSSSHQIFFFVLLLGQFLHGSGASPFYTLGVTYIDENVEQTASPLYLGLYLAFSTIGPAVGFILGGFLLKIYGDFLTVDPHNSAVFMFRLGLEDSSDTRWYGAWWIGFCITGVMGLIASVPMLGFASECPGREERRKKDVDQTRPNKQSHVAFEGNVADIARSFLVLFSNPTFVGLVIMQTAEACMLNGFITFIPKLFENLFNYSSSQASLIAGAIIIPCSFVGNVLGGAIIRRFALRCGQMILLSLACSAISGAMILIFLVRCPEVEFAGVTQPLSGNSRVGDLSSVCNADCNCPRVYKPMCDDGGLTHFSPCHAGCFGNDSGTNAKYYNCSCTSAALLSNGSAIEERKPLTIGLCAVDCGFGLIAILSVFALLTFFTFANASPVQQSTLRCVPFSQRTMAVGFGWVIMRLFGSIPGPILLGAVLDKTCTLWNEKCGVRQSCLRYSVNAMSNSVLIFGLVCKTIILLALFVAWWFYRVEPEDGEVRFGSAVVKTDGAVAKIVPAEPPAASMETIRQVMD